MPIITMPNFKDKKERNEWYRKYRIDNRKKLRRYNLIFNAQWRIKKKRGLIKSQPNYKICRICGDTMKQNIKVCGGKIDIGCYLALLKCAD